MLYRILNYYDSLKLYQKIELYLLPIFILGYLIYYYYQINSYQPISTNIQTTQVVYPQITQKQNNSIEFLKKLESKAKRYSVKVLSYDINDTQIKLYSSGGFKGSMNFIYEVDKSHKIIALDIHLCTNTKSLCTQLLVENENQSINFPYKSILRELDTIQNPFISISKEKSLNNQIKLKAIFDDYVLVDKEFIYIGQSYNGYKLIKIEENGATFSYKNSIIKVGI